MLSRITLNKIIPGNIVIKLLELSDKKKFLKVGREKKAHCLNKAKVKNYASQKTMDQSLQNTARKNKCCQCRVL